MEYNELRGDSGIAFAEGLEANTTLTALNLSHAALGDRKNKGAVWLKVAAALRGGSITELDISGNDVKSEDATLMADVLPETSIRQ